LLSISGGTEILPLWILAYAGMTVRASGMTGEEVGMMREEAGTTLITLGGRG
jgi:hypothetical protein